jgi:hypothetical protein
MKQYKIQNRSQKNSQSCVPLKGLFISDLLINELHLPHIQYLSQAEGLAPTHLSATSCVPSSTSSCRFHLWTQVLGPQNFKTHGFEPLDPTAANTHLDVYSTYVLHGPTWLGTLLILDMQDPNYGNHL